MNRIKEVLDAKVLAKQSWQIDLERPLIWSIYIQQTESNHPSMFYIK